MPAVSFGFATTSQLAELAGQATTALDRYDDWYYRSHQAVKVTQGATEPDFTAFDIRSKRRLDEVNSSVLFAIEFTPVSGENVVGFEVFARILLMIN
jgi:hypothetical protein